MKLHKSKFGTAGCGDRRSGDYVADAEFMQCAINNSQIAKLEASHLSNIEQPQRFTQELTRFIQQI